MRTHPTADEIYEKTLAACPNISRATVYRILGQLADSGEILRVAVANAPDRFDLTTKRHTHCLCAECGRVFDYRLLTEPLIDDSGNDGFIATGYDIIVNGTCGECAGKSRNGNGSRRS